MNAKINLKSDKKKDSPVKVVNNTSNKDENLDLFLDLMESMTKGDDHKTIELLNKSKVFLNKFSFAYRTRK